MTCSATKGAGVNWLEVAVGLEDGALSLLLVWLRGFGVKLWSDMLPEV